MITPETETLLRRLGRQVLDLPSRYTRAYGPESNAERVLMLVDGDVAVLGGRILAVLDTGEDPGDERHACLQMGCPRPQHHSGAHA